MKGFITILIAAAAAFTLASAVSAQKTEDHLPLLYNGELVSVLFDAEREEKFTEQQAKLYAILDRSINSRTEKIDISEAGYTSMDELRCFVTETLNVETFWQRITGDILYTADDSSGIIEFLEVEYYPYDENAVMSVFSRSAGITTVRQGMDHALGEVEEGMDEIEKALVLHDYIVRECDYYPAAADELERIGEENPAHNMFKAEGVFIDRLAVCQGYAVAYSQLLRECGITSCIVVSDEMKHAWNMVKIGEDWYHVDVTWDDPGNVRGGFVFHKYFLRSDDEFSDESLAEGERHYNWNLENSLYSVSGIGGTPEANVSNSFTNYAFREIAVRKGGADLLYQPRLLNYMDGYYYTLMHERYAPGKFYSNSNILCITDISGSDRRLLEMDETYDYLMELNGKLYASRDNHIAEINTNGVNVRYLAFEKDGRIVNFWNKLDSLSYAVVRDGMQIECRLDPDADISVLRDGIRYALYPDGTAAVIGYSNPAVVEILNIPAEINGRKVTEIGSRAFQGAEPIRRVVIPDSVVKIGEEAFLQSGITEAVLPVGLKTIAHRAFWNCSELTHIEIPVTVHELGNEVFASCLTLLDVKFHGIVPDSMGRDVFKECGNGYIDQFGNPLGVFTLLLNPHRKAWGVIESAGKKTWTDSFGMVYPVAYYDAPLLGDSNDDNVVDNIDLNAILGYFNGRTTAVPSPEWADIDGYDGVTRKDAMLIARYIAGWDSVKEYFE